MFVTKRRRIDIVNLFVSIKMKKRGSTNERLHVFPKDEKGYPIFNNLLLWRQDGTDKFSTFGNILQPSKLQKVHENLIYSGLFFPAMLINLPNSRVFLKWG